MVKVCVDKLCVLKSFLLLFTIFASCYNLYKNKLQVNIKSFNKENVCVFTFYYLQYVCYRLLIFWWFCFFVQYLVLKHVLMQFLKHTFHPSIILLITNFPNIKTMWVDFASQYPVYCNRDMGVCSLDLDH